MNSRILTLETLVRLRACREQIARFQRLFGDHVEVTIERASQPDVEGFDFSWAVERLLRPEIQGEFFVEARRRQEALMRNFQVEWYTETPLEERAKLAATIWAEFYIKDAPLVESTSEPELKVEGVVYGNG